MAMAWAAACLSLCAQDNKARENEQEAVRALEQIATAQVTFREKDLDSNALADYWVGDVSGLYRIAEPAGPIKLIPEALAKADMAPRHESKLLGKPLTDKPVPYHGYLFKVIPNHRAVNDALEKYDAGGGVNADRYAVCAIPADYGKTGTRTYVVSEAGLVHSKDTGGKAVDYFPQEVWDCRGQLKDIGAHSEIYRLNFGGPDQNLPENVGLDYFVELKRTLEMGDDGSDLFKCPEGGKRRGPAKDINVAKNYADSDPIVVCEHPDGTLRALTRGYRVVEIRKEDEEQYKRALEGTTDK
jgi:hypothetical protein